MLAVTWIAPEIPGLPTLAWLAEMSKMQQLEGVELHSLTGPTVTRGDVAKALQEACDLLLWSGHGEAGSLLLPGRGDRHEKVRPRWLTGAIQRIRPRLVVLAACGSQARDEDLKSLSDTLSRGGLNTISFPARTADDAAAKFSLALVWALAGGCPLGDAYDIAVEEIADTETVQGVFLTPGLVDPVQSVTLGGKAVDIILANLEVLLGNRYVNDVPPPPAEVERGDTGPVRRPPVRGQLASL